MIGRCGTLRSVAREEGSIQQYASVCRPRDSGVGGVSMILRARPSPLLALCLLLLAMLLSCFPARQVARAGGGLYGDLSGIRLLAETGDTTLDQAQRYALAAIARNYGGDWHAASLTAYSFPWVRDSYAWGMITSRRDPSLAAYSGSEIRYWLAHQQRYGGWLTRQLSGHFDETPIFIAAVLDAYRVSGDLSLVRRALPQLERGWSWMAHSYIRPARGSSALIYALVPPYVAADWADQIARSGYATGLEALWYHATTSLATMEALSGRPTKAHTFGRFAVRIKRDINRLLWAESAPYVSNAPKVAPFGHYVGWRGPRRYFELDSNFLCILYGIADRRQSESIVAFVERHGGYLFGLDGGTGIPARVLYGDYAAADYAYRRGKIGKGLYQSAYWPSVGGLVALALTRIGHLDEARVVLARIAEGIVVGGDIREWYGKDGQGQGAQYFQWGARMYLVALCAAFGHPGPGATPPAAHLAARLFPAVAGWRWPRSVGGIDARTYPA